VKESKKYRGYKITSDATRANDGRWKATYIIEPDKEDVQKLKDIGLQVLETDESFNAPREAIGTSLECACQIIDAALGPEKI
jgi:hypothetical protein